MVKVKLITPPYLVFFWCFLSSFYFSAEWMWDLSSLIRDWTPAPCSKSTESYPLDHYGKSLVFSLLISNTKKPLRCLRQKLKHHSDRKSCGSKPRNSLKHIHPHPSPGPRPGCYISTCVVTLLLLLLSRFRRVPLCATPLTAAHQAPLTLAFSR